MHNESYTDINSKGIDKWIEDGWEWGIPISHETFAKAKNGDWRVVLTPTKPVPAAWFEPHMKNGKLNGVKLLGLASGGGQQMPVFAALGAECTILDNSSRQLASERLVAEREGYGINIVKADMTKALPFEDESFEIIFNPVSLCYIEDVYHIWRECHRVLKRGGLLLMGNDNGVSFLFEDGAPLKAVNKLPYNPMKNPEQYKQSFEMDGTIQFSHTMEELIGGQLKAGFTLTDLYEDQDWAEGGIGSYYPQCVATRAVKG